MKPNPVDFFRSATENLASLVSGENFYFTRPVCGFPGATFTHPACIICVCLKKANQQPDRNEQPGGNFANPVTFFPKPGENINCTGSLT